MQGLRVVGDKVALLTEVIGILQDKEAELRLSSEAMRGLYCFMADINESLAASVSCVERIIKLENKGGE